MKWEEMTIKRRAAAWFGLFLTKEAEETAIAITEDDFKPDTPGPGEDDEADDDFDDFDDDDDDDD